jgi:glutamate racemase
MEPAIKPAAASSHTRKIGVLATRGTLAGDLFVRTRGRFAQKVAVITQTADGLVEKIEAGEVDSLETEVLLRRYLEPLRDAGADEIVLGCTHYPFVALLIQKIVGPNIMLIDPSAAVAHQVARVIDERGWRNETAHAARYCFYTSGDPDTFARVMEKLVGVRAAVKRATP